MAGTDTVKAQVRLRFRNTSGTRMSCVRNLQVTKKKGGGLTMKTLEGVLGVDDDAADPQARASISTRCAELDQEMASLLGVSHAILENVLFCHQEESNWPLSEPAILKKRFDEIFEVSRYTKALDSIRALRKQRAQDARVDEAELRALQNEKERAENIKATIRTLEASLSAKKNERDDLDAAIQRKTTENQQLYDDATRFREVVNQAEMLEEKIALCEEHKASLLSRMTLLAIPDSELQDELTALPTQLETQHARLSHVRSNMQVYLDKRSSAAEEHERLVRRHAELETAERTRQRVLQATANELRTFGSDISSAPTKTQFDAFSTMCEASLREKLQEHEIKAEQHQRAADELESQALTEYEHLETRLRDLKSQREHTGASLQRLHERIMSCENQLARQASTTSVCELDKAREHLAELGSVSLPDVQEAMEHLATLEAERDAIATSFVDSQQDTKHVARQEELASKLPVLRERENLWHQMCVERLGHVPKNLEEELEQAEHVLDQSQAQLLKASEQVVQWATTVDVYQDVLSRSEKLCSSLHDAKQILLGDFASVDAGLVTVQEEIQVLQESLFLLEHASAFFERIQHHAHARHMCLACNRDISSSQLHSVDAHIEETRQRKQPEKVAALEQDLDAWNRQLSNLYAARAIEKQLREQQESELSRLVAQLEDAKKRHQDAEGERDRSSGATASAVARVKTLRSLQVHMHRLVDLRLDVQLLKRQLDSIDSTSASATTSNASPETLKALSQEIHAQQAHCHELREQCDQHRNRVREAERHVHALEMQLMTEQQHAAATQAAHQRLEEYMADAKDLEKQRETLTFTINELTQPHSEAQKHLEDTRRERREQEERYKEKRSDLEQQLAKLAGMVQRVSSAWDDAGADDSALVSCSMELDRAAQALQHTQKEAERATQDTYALETAIHDVRAREANLQDNVRYRQVLRELEHVTAELNKLDLETAHTRHKRASSAYDAARREENELSGRAAHIRGEIQGIEAELQRREAELRHDYKDISKRYMQQLVHIKVAGMANHDLDIYCGALQQAILQYHAIKMEEVNQTLDYLWKKTYQGTDIDSISIRSDTEGRVSANGLRSYQYRVCMVKDAVELDMRGRCSAGQKVLACILIRLALADSFGGSCGFMALDEPTANLDRENVEGLAASLIEYV